MGRERRGGPAVEFLGSSAGTVCARTRCVSRERRGSAWHQCGPPSPDSSAPPCSQGLGVRRSISLGRSVQLPFAIVSTGENELGKRGITLHEPGEIRYQRRLRLLELLVGLLADQNLPALCTRT